MAQFIHLSLLLATIQPPLVSMTWIYFQEGPIVSFKFHPGCKVHRWCRGDQCVSSPLEPTLPENMGKLTKRDLTISTTSLGPSHSGDYHCHIHIKDHIWDITLTLIVKTGCINDHLDGFDFSYQQLQEQERKPEYECRKQCENSTCEYFTFKKGGKYFLIFHGGCVKIQPPNSVSVYPDMVVCNDKKDAVSLQFHQENKSWFEALKHCRDKNLSLVQITNSTIQHEVKSLLQNQSSSFQAGVWIGLERSMFGKYPVAWKWISGSEIGKPDQWNSSFPVDSLNNHCGKIIWVNDTDFKWLDAWCHEELPFICQDAA